MASQSPGTLSQLSSKFYTLIPHNFGRKVPDVINTESVVNQKKEMLITLADIELTQSLQKNTVRNKTKSERLIFFINIMFSFARYLKTFVFPQIAKPTENPMDAKMRSLGCSLELLPRNCKEFKAIIKCYDIVVLLKWKLVSYIRRIFFYYTVYL